MVMNSEKIYVVPDVHGRQFWHDVEKIDDYEKIIFLGDYVDPYPHEGVKPVEGMKCLKEIIQFAKDHENVVLLMGNHDSTYMLSTYLCECRTDYDNFPEIRKTFLDNKDMFKLAYYLETEYGPVMFTHAGLFSDWLDTVFGDMPTWSNKEIADRLNDDFQYLLDSTAKEDGTTNLRNYELFRDLSQVSHYRGGWGNHGSCIWSDIREHVGEVTDLPFFQVVGHTMLEEGKIVKLEHIACVDSQKVWKLSEIYEAPLSIK
jgi:hypothetical protein